MLLPNMGVGLFLFGERFYAGLSSPHVIEWELRKPNDPGIPVYSRRYRHYYASVGAAFPLYAATTSCSSRVSS